VLLANRSYAGKQQPEKECIDKGGE